MKNTLIKFTRANIFQGMWEKLHHISKIGMNYWGGASLYHSGEIKAMEYVYNKLKNEKSIIVFDVGANLGQYAILAQKVFKTNTTIYSFEPSSFTYEKLKEYTKSFDNIKTYNIGLGDKKDQLKLYSSGQGSSLASVYNLENPLSTFNEEYSEVITIDTINNFCHEHNIETIDFLKVDVEGHELFTLIGASEIIKKKKIKYIQFEFGECHIDSRTYFRDFYKLLSPDYNFYRVVPNGLRKIKSYTTDLEVFDTSNFFLMLK
jgi:FkbM family methyltransferase